MVVPAVIESFLIKRRLFAKGQKESSSIEISDNLLLMDFGMFSIGEGKRRNEFAE